MVCNTDNLELVAGLGVDEDTILSLQWLNSRSKSCTKRNERRVFLFGGDGQFEVVVAQAILVWTYEHDSDDELIVETLKDDACMMLECCGVWSFLYLLTVGELLVGRASKECCKNNLEGRGKMTNLIFQRSD